MKTRTHMKSTRISYVLGGRSTTTRNVNEPIQGYVFDVKGLMGDISLKGAKFSKIDPAQ
jgi:hypothetical protein